MTVWQQATELAKAIHHHEGHEAHEEGICTQDFAALGIGEMI